SDRNLIDFRFPVQMVIRPNQNFRGYAGRVASGQIRQGEEVVVLPSGKSSLIKAIEHPDQSREQATAGESVVITLEDELDISRGDMLVRRHNLPHLEKNFDAMLCWLSETPLDPQITYLLKHTTRTVRVQIEAVQYQIDVNQLTRIQAGNLRLNEIGRVSLQTAMPLAFDAYRSNHLTGSFILIDPISNHTVAAGMIRGPSRRIEELSSERSAQAYTSPNVTRSFNPLTRPDWEARNGHHAAVIWFTGLSGAGKSTLAIRLAQALFLRNCQVVTLDGDNLRHGLCGDLGFSARDRSENIRRTGEVAKLFYEQGNIVICTLISPFRQDREFVRSLIPKPGFVEIFARCDLEICRQRDPKGLYKKAESGEIPEFTGISSPYEEPLNPELILDSGQENPETLIQASLAYLEVQGILSQKA
ncbi:MAG: adenylyl-sulfate kinase, partial [Candidatus Melainabacteria bacterium HGW-Melainabacteria-1]